VNATAVAVVWVWPREAPIGKELGIVKVFLHLLIHRQLRHLLFALAGAHNGAFRRMMLLLLVLLLVAKGREYDGEVRNVSRSNFRW
jgi:hypothetical protein